MGIDFWKIPLANNENFLEDIRDLLDSELIADNLMEDH